MLNLVEHHQPSQRPELEAGLGEPGAVRRILQVEPSDRPVARRGELPGQRRLPYLPRSQQDDDGKIGQQRVQTGQMPFAKNLHDH